MSKVDKKMINVLLIEGRARQVLPMAKSLRKLGCIVTTYNTSKLDPGYASKYPHRKIIGFCDARKPNETYRAVHAELLKYKYDIVIPLNDDIAIVLSKHKDELRELTTVAVNDWDIIQYSIDKLKTMEICMKNGLPCPKTYLNKTEFVNDVQNAKFPMVVKPRTGCAAVGFHVSYDREDLLSYYRKAEAKYGPCLIQEYIPQTDLQYKAELYIDDSGKLKAACVFSKVRWYPIDGGSSTLNVTVNRPDIVESCKTLLEKINWRGYADIDLIQDPRDGIAKIMEINPRITGSVKICFEAGVNFSKLIIQDFLGEPVDALFDVKYDTYLRYMHTDVLWFIKSPSRFSCKPSWFNFKNCTDQIFSWTDLFPFFAFSLQSLSKIIKDKKKRDINL